MLTHIGVLTLAPSATEDNRLQIVQGLASLIGQVDGLVSVRTATDVGLKEDTADIVFELTFASQQAWEMYGGHPAHKRLIAKHIAPVLASKVFLQVSGFVEVSA